MKVTLKQFEALCALAFGTRTTESLLPLEQCGLVVRCGSYYMVTDLARSTSLIIL